VAASLAAKGRRVLILERGGLPAPGRTRNVSMSISFERIALHPSEQWFRHRRLNPFKPPGDLMPLGRPTPRSGAPCLNACARGEFVRPGDAGKVRPALGPSSYASLGPLVMTGAEALLTGSTGGLASIHRASTDHRTFPPAPGDRAQSRAAALGPGAAGCVPTERLPLNLVRRSRGIPAARRVVPVWRRPKHPAHQASAPGPRSPRCT